jgi:hypothetical protein
MTGNALKCSVLVVLLFSVGAVVATAGPAGPAGTPFAAFELFRALAGEWVAADDGEMYKKGDVVARYAVTASGTAVVETVFPGSPHEMVTVYHPDGADLVLTHFCMEGNQPRMRARQPKGARFEFTFDGGANIDPGRDRHMHSAWLEILGADEIRNEWTEHAEGKTVLVVRSHLVRKAR